MAQRLIMTREVGLEHEGEVYRSLSAVAKAVTGSHWSGNLFFGISPAKGRRDK